MKLTVEFIKQASPLVPQVFYTSPEIMNNFETSGLMWIMEMLKTKGAFVYPYFGSQVRVRQVIIKRSLC